MLEVAAETPYDLKFQIFRIPVRVHPLFWVVTACMGWGGKDYQFTLIWMAAVFVSILVHEFGHGLISRRFGAQPSILLQSMGGLCTSTGGQSTSERILVILAGPAAGLAFFLLIITGCNLAVGMTLREAFALEQWGNPLQIMQAYRRIGQLGSPIVINAVLDLIHINLYWSLFNLVPIYPLDGGQLLETVLVRGYRTSAVRWTYIVGIALSAGLAVYRFQTSGQSILIFFLLYLAFYNYQMLQSISGRGFDRWN